MSDVKEDKCNCNDPLREGQCPEHPSEEVSYPVPPTPNVILVTAKDRVEPTKKSTWVGFAFKCKGCGENSIMYWGGNHGFKYCPECGVPLKYEWEKPTTPKSIVG